MSDVAWLALFFFTAQGGDSLEEPQAVYGDPEEGEVRDMLGFVRCALSEGAVPPAPLGTVRITGTLRIFVGEEELRLRPMAKTILLLFLRHPEGIVLKRISDYREELTAIYLRLTKTTDPDVADRRICRLLDVFSNELNVNISRVNAALSALVGPDCRVSGRAGKPKSIQIDRSLVVWE